MFLKGAFILLWMGINDVHTHKHLSGLTKAS
jgi:hypothetical protein